MTVWSRVTGCATTWTCSGKLIAMVNTVTVALLDTVSTKCTLLACWQWTKEKTTFSEVFEYLFTSNLFTFRNYFQRFFHDNSFSFCIAIIFPNPKLMVVKTLTESQERKPWTLVNIYNSRCSHSSWRFFLETSFWELLLYDCHHSPINNLHAQWSLVDKPNS